MPTAARSFTVVAGTVTTAQGGTVTLDTDGGFVYMPKPTRRHRQRGLQLHGQRQCRVGQRLRRRPDHHQFVATPTSGMSTASGANGASDGSSLRSVHIFTQLNGAGGAGDVDAANDTIFVYGGTYTGGLVLEAGQNPGERHGLDAPDGGGAAGITTLLAANAGAGQPRSTAPSLPAATTTSRPSAGAASAGVSLSGTNVGTLDVNDAKRPPRARSTTPPAAASASTAAPPG